MEYWIIRSGPITPVLHDSSVPVFDMDPIKITIDGKEVVTEKGKTVIQAAAEAGA